jgi:hypothetical protein
MTLYFTCIFCTSTELGIYDILIVCYTILYAYLHYTSMLSIGLPYCNGGVCLRACSSLRPVGHHGSGARGASSSDHGREHGA